MMVRSRATAFAVMLAIVALAGCAAPSDESTQNDGRAPTSATPSDANPPTSTTPTTSGVDGGSGPDHQDSSAIEEGRVSSAPGAPVEVALEVADATAFFSEGTTVVVTVTGMSSEALRAGLVVPEGVEIVSGEVRYEGALDERAPVRLQSVLRATTPGEHALRAFAEIPLGTGSRAAPSVLMLVRGDASTASFDAPERPGPLFGVKLAPASDDPLQVRATFVAHEVAATRIVFLVPDAFGDARGAREENVTLTPEAALGRAFSLPAPTPWGDGYVVVWAYAYPDAAVDGRLYSDALYYWWEGDALRAADAPPGEGVVEGGASAGGATANDTDSTPAPVP